MQKIIFLFGLLAITTGVMAEDEMGLYVLDSQNSKGYQAVFNSEQNKWMPVLVEASEKTETTNQDNQSVDLGPSKIKTTDSTSDETFKPVARVLSPGYRDGVYMASFAASQIMTAEKFEDIFQVYVCHFYNACDQLVGTVIQVDNEDNFWKGKPYIVTAKVPLKNGRKHGVSETYSPEGKLLETCTYENGIENGPLVQYYPNGHVKWKGNYRNGKLNGLDQAFNEQGQLSVEATYVDNVLKGPMKVYYPSGKVRVEGIYTGNRFEVKNLVFYNENGEVIDKHEVATFMIKY